MCNTYGKCFRGRLQIRRLTTEGRAWGIGSLPLESSFVIVVCRTALRCLITINLPRAICREQYNALRSNSWKCPMPNGGKHYDERGIGSYWAPLKDRWRHLHWTPCFRRTHLDFLPPPCCCVVLEYVHRCLPWSADERRVCLPSVHLVDLDCILANSDPTTVP